ncbi:MAG: cytidylate kinase family protein [Clostridiales bacterium]|jgi:cytidylate kinase|nr:cytidylate kinase family protein [Clostridiales bacterium]
MAIITISRQNGSLGDEIADALASRLGTTVISRKYALDNFFGEINPGTLDRLNESAKFFETTLPGSTRTYADILVERIRALASESKDKDLIILGMGGSVLLSGFPGALHVRVTASETTRLNTIARKYHITTDEASEVLTIADRKHRKFVRTVYGKDITSPEQFDLILNTDRLSVDECVDAVVELARKHDLRVRLSESNENSGTIDHQTRNTAFKNETEEEFARILSMYNIEWLYEPKTFPVEWDAEGNVTMAISPDFYLPRFNLYLELTTMDQRYVTKKNKKMRLVKELYPGTNIRIVYKKDFNELVDRLKMFGGLTDKTPEET